MSKKIAIIQSNYIPWKGYFDIINRVDEFILVDDVQYTRRDWRNRNKIKSPQGTIWLTIPVEVKGKYEQPIKDTKIADLKWAKKHWTTIMSNYAKAPYFQEYKDQFEACYLNLTETSLSQVNYRFIQLINTILGIKTIISWSSDYRIVEGKNERLIALCKQAQATEYISGPSAKGYIDEKLFQQEHIRLTWMDYSGYPEYHQLFPPFDHYVSVLDVIFNEGPNATNFMLSFQRKRL